MGVLPVLDYYALAVRRTLAAYFGGAGGVDLVEGGKITMNYKDPLMDRLHWCRLADMQRWHCIVTR